MGQWVIDARNLLEFVLMFVRQRVGSRRQDPTKGKTEVAPGGATQRRTVGKTGAGDAKQRGRKIYLM